MSAAIIVGATFLVPKIGTGALFVMLVTGQILAGMIINHFGLLGVPVQPVNWVAAAGGLLVILGAALVTFATKPVVFSAVFVRIPGHGSGERIECGFDFAENAVFWKFTFLVPLASCDSGEQLNSFFNGFDRVNAELVIATGSHHLASKHEMFDVRFRYQNALVAGESSFLADFKVALDLFVYPTDRLDFSVLVDLTGYRKSLTNGNSGKRG